MTSRVSSSLLTSCAHHAISCPDLYIRASFVYSCINLNQTSKHRHTKCKQKHRVEYVFFYDGIIERCEFMKSCHTSHIYFMIRMFERRSNPPPSHCTTIYLKCLTFQKTRFYKCLRGVFRKH